MSLKLNDSIPDAPSISTLKRLWAYVSDSSTRSKSTLNALSRFLGYTDWVNYMENLMRDNHVESGFLTTSNLHTGDLVELTWNPGRRLVIEYLGDNRYAERESENAKLKKGVTFCSLIITQRLPLYCNNVTVDSEPLEDYVAGTKTGITSLKYIPLQKG